MGLRRAKPRLRLFFAIVVDARAEVNRRPFEPQRTQRGTEDTENCFYNRSRETDRGLRCVRPRFLLRLARAREPGPYARADEPCPGGQRDLPRLPGRALHAAVSACPR